MSTPKFLTQSIPKKGSSANQNIIGYPSTKWRNQNLQPLIENTLITRDLEAIDSIKRNPEKKPWKENLSYWITICVISNWLIVDCNCSL